jgi:hypothetical protein
MLWAEQLPGVNESPTECGRHDGNDTPIAFWPQAHLRGRQGDFML